MRNQQNGSRRLDDPKILTEPDWKVVARRMWALSGKDNLSLVASGIAFNAFLAFVPFLTSIILTYGILASVEQVARHIAMLSDLLPEQVSKVIGSQLTQMVETARSTTGFSLVVTLGIALYGALRGATGIVSGLNIVFEVEESRPFLSQLLVAFAITFGLIFSFLLASVGITVLGFLSEILPDVGGVVHDGLQIAFWIAAAIGVSVVVALIYRHAPDRGDLPWRWLTPGSVLATGTWLAGTFAFGIYVRSFGNFQAVYGALGAVIVFLLWLYISAYILLLGAELNQVLQGKTGGKGDGTARP